MKSLSLRNPLSDDNQVDPGFRLLYVAMIIGLLLIAAVSTSVAGTNGSWIRTFGYTSMVGVASLATGGLLGFLFGIPRSAQSTELRDASENKMNDNTNLEQISDWLTKILVGVSIAQTKEIMLMVDNLAKMTSQGLGAENPFTYPFSMSLLIFFFIVGFFSTYLWSRVILKKVFGGGFKAQLKAVSEEMERVRRAQMTRVVSEVQRAERDEHIQALLRIAGPSGVTDYQDAQKGRWGGSAENKSRRIELMNIERGSERGTFTIIVRILSTSSDHPLTGSVWFFLHNTYNNMIREVSVKNGEAQLKFDSYEAFTIGAVCDDGATKLELDLNELKNVPDEYKYVKTEI